MTSLELPPLCQKVVLREQLGQPHSCHQRACDWHQSHGPAHHTKHHTPEVDRHISAQGGTLLTATDGCPYPQAQLTILPIDLICLNQVRQVFATQAARVAISLQAMALKNKITI